MLSRVGLGLRPQLIRSNLIRSNLTKLSLRSISTVKASHDKEQEILVQQRKNRPESPHLTIYQPQLTWILSSFHRLTGVALAGGFYAVTVGYAVANLTGLFQFDSTVLVSAFASLPFVAQIGVKAAAAYPFVYHVANGIRHLVWDFGKQLTIPGVYRTGYAVLAATAVFGSYLTFF